MNSKIKFKQCEPILKAKKVKYFLPKREEWIHLKTINTYKI